METLLKLTPISEDPLCHSKIEESLHSIDDQIRQVNRYGCQEKFKANLLFESLAFAPKTLNFPVEYLGNPILLGSLHCIWVGRDRQVQSQNFGAFLFKTHLVLAQVMKFNRFEVKFLIPLSICKVVDSSDCLGGLFTQYQHSFKLIFEHRYTMIELMCLQNDSLESQVWKDKLSLLINYVNGPYEFDYSSSNSNEELGTYCSLILPPFIQPFDAKLNKLKSIRLKNQKSIFTQCYFSDIIPIKVEHVSINDDRGQVYKTITKFENIEGTLIHLKETERARIEYLLQDLWSDELVSNAILTRRKQSTKKRGSRLYSSKSSRNQTSTRSQSFNNPDLQQPIDSENNSTVRSTSRVSIMRRTSIVFGGALKAIMNTDH